jgi:hypothetical protein
MLDVNALDARAKATRERSKLLESLAGTELHDNARDHLGRLSAPQSRHLPGGQRPGDPPLPRQSDHLVAFRDARDFHFAASDADRVLAGLSAYHARYRDLKPRDLTGSQNKLVEIIPRHQVEGGALSVWAQDWNDILHALFEMGLGVSIAPLVSDGTTP